MNFCFFVKKISKSPNNFFAASVDGQRIFFSAAGIYEEKAIQRDDWGI